MINSRIGSQVNLEEVRSQLTERVALFLILGSAAVIAGFLPVHTFPTAGFVSGLAFIGLGAIVRRLSRSHPALARHLLLWGLAAALMSGMHFATAPWLPFLGLGLMFVGSMLLPGGGLAVGVLIAALAAWLVQNGARDYPLLELVLVLAFGLVLAWLATRTLYTTLEWAWSTRLEANRLLELARDRQGELTRTLKSFDLANSLLLRTQRELVFARRQSEEAQRLKEQFAANVSHELRTPLNLIMGFSELMYLSPEVYGDMVWPPALRHDVSQIYRSSRHLRDMINDVLDLSRSDLVGFTLDRELTPLEPFLRDTLEMVRELFREHSVRLELAISNALPALEIDRTRIRQVLLNLLNNAVRFTEQGVVRVMADVIGGEVQIRVADTGPGIPTDELTHIFEEFYQIDRSLSRKQQGAGLGMAICRQFVQAHDGRIWVESQVGQGSTFSFTLPVPGQSVPLSRMLPSSPVVRVGGESQKPVLVVDGDPAVAAFLHRHLPSLGVAQVADAEQLPELIRLLHPRAVIVNAAPTGPAPAEGREDRPGQTTDAGSLLLPTAPFIECSLPSRDWLVAERGLTAHLSKPMASTDLLRAIERLGDVCDVLVVDDDRGFCQLVERILNAKAGHLSVRQAYSAADGLAEMRARRPDVVLLDLVLPDLGGYQVIDTMRSEPTLATVPVILVTAVDLAEQMLAQRSSYILIRRPDGLRPVEVLRCLDALISVLAPPCDERSLPDQPLA